MSAECSTRYKLSYIHNPGTEPLLSITLGRALQNAAEKWSDKIAIISRYEGESYTFKQALEKADALAAGLLQFGLKQGDRVAIWGPNSCGWYISRLAVARAGLIAVQIDPAYRSQQLLHALNTVEVKVLICAENLGTTNFYKTVLTLIPELNDCPESGVEINNPKLPALKTLIVISNKQYRGAFRLQDVIVPARPNVIQEIHHLQELIQPDDDSNIQFTSGSTGNPKAALLTNHSLINNSYYVGKRMEFHMEDVKLVVVTQFCHGVGIIGAIITGILFGNTIVLPSPVFDAKKALEAIINERCSHIFATPSLYKEMIATKLELDLEITTLKVATCTGAPCTKQLAKNIKEIFNINRLSSLYGMTEVAAIFLSCPEDSEEQTMTTVGYIMDHCEVKAVDKEGRMVPMGTPGELWVRGYSVMKQYWNDDERTRQFISSDKWAKTGDLFVLHDDGYGRIIGRTKDVIIRIADKIVPSEIEEFFEAHPDILEAQVFGVPDPKVGEEVCVYLQPKKEVKLTEEDIVNYCKDKIADFLIPRYIRFVSDFEKTAVLGKVQKKKLLERLQSEISSTNNS